MGKTSQLYQCIWVDCLEIVTLCTGRKDKVPVRSDIHKADPVILSYAREGLDVFFSAICF